MSGANAHLDLAQGLEFPDHYGRNLHALSDCLRDLPIHDSAGTAVELRDYDNFMRRDPDLACGLLDVFTRSSSLLQIFGKTLLILVHCKDPDIDFGPLGAFSASWNHREFIRSNRCGGGPV